MNFESKNKKHLVARIIRINDFTKIANEFDSFKKKVMDAMDPDMSNKVH